MGNKAPFVRATAVARKHDKAPLVPWLEVSERAIRATVKEGPLALSRGTRGRASTST